MSISVAESLLCSRLTGAATGWFRGALVSIRASPDQNDVLPRLWSEAGRRLGQARIVLSAMERTQVAFSPDGWGSDEYGRALLLLAALDVGPPNMLVARVDELWRTGEIRERQALLRVLAHLPRPNDLVPVGVEAVRSNATSIIEAIACENPFPAAHFSDEAFNQMVLKCLFCGLSLRRVLGLDGRLSPELQRMVAAYASERLAAGRTVSDDAHLVLEGGAHAPI